MKQEKNIKTKAESQNRQGIKDTLAVARVKLNQMNLKVTATNGNFNIFLNQNIGKGPPGRTRSPVAARGHPPAVEERPPENKAAPIGSNSTNYNEVQLVYKKSKFNLLQTFNLLIMKKQILILVMFTLALIFAGTKSYGQDLNYIPGTALAPVTAIPCATADALHPIPGTTYTYTVTVAPGVSTGYIQWFAFNATASGTLITGGSIAAAIAAAEVNTGASQYLLLADATKYKLTTNTSNSITAAWQSFDGSTKTILLVAYVKGEGGCSDNIEVFHIQPTFSFTLDIAGLMPDGSLPASGNAKECVTPVQSAVYASSNLTMDYGDNYVYFTVTAANFVHSWTPTFTIPTNTTQTTVAVTDITWAYPLEAVKNAAGAATGTWNAATAPVLAVAGSGAVGATGEAIIVRVHLDHGNKQNAVAGAITVGIDGVMYNVPTTNYANAALKDLDPGAAPGPCTNTVTDVATYDLTPRPLITATAPLVLEPKN